MTANELIRRILMSVGVLGESDTPSAEQANDTFVSINQFLSSLGGAEGFVTRQYPDPTADIGLDDGYELMIQTNVAVIVAPDYGKEASPTTQRLAASTKRALKRATTQPRMLRLDGLLAATRRGAGTYNIITDDYT